MSGIPNRSMVAHEERVALLEDLAILSGYIQRLRLPIPIRPDVVFIDPAEGSVFIGEAKAAESPRNPETLRRLESYFSCFRALAETGRGGSLFVLCFGRERDSTGWRQTLMRMAQGAGIRAYYLGEDRLGDDFLVWLGLSRRLLVTPSTATSA